MKFKQAISGMMAYLMIAGFYWMPQTSWAEDTAHPWVGRVVSIQGHVLAKRHGRDDWLPVRLDDTFFFGDRIRSEANSRAGVVLSNDTVIRLDQNTTLAFAKIEQPDTFFMKLLKGAAQFFSRWPHRLTIATPFVNGVIEGTEFFVRVDDEQTQIDLFEGHLRAVNEFGELTLTKGNGALATAGQPPLSRVLVHPRDSVQWCLYYPPILAVESHTGLDALTESMALYEQGQAAAALNAMEKIEEDRRDSRFFAYRAGVLLNVGRVVQAHKDIQRALSLDAANGDALALEAIIAVVQNRKLDAARSAQKAVQIDPRSAAAQIALSYVEQADFNLPAAAAAAQNAVTHDPGNAIAWARLAELRLSSGQLDKGIRAAIKATVLKPNISHAHTILGFAFLTKIKTEQAREAFVQAINLDSAAPLPRLGLGLAMIRDGRLREGRKEIEIAVGLDPGNALVRSYLGKAYFDEKRDDLDQRQFEIAKGLDPLDPTPWFYDAIRKQTINRPVEALKDLQKSIELNDNRAVFRSRLLLDEDLAARSASLARIYDDLGFEQAGLVEASKSISLDPTNYSAHRFLSDTYARLPRHEIARKSELLQSQLLQPINVNPVQPSLALSDLNLVANGGPAGAGFNEYTPLFERDKIQLVASGMLGNNETRGDEIVLSGLRESVSFSLGQFHVETDGFRSNNDVEHDVYNLFAQMALNPSINIQAEYLYREKNQGDLNLNFDPDDFSPENRRKMDQNVVRIGGRLRVNPRSSVLLSVVYNDRDAEQGPMVSTNTEYGFPITTKIFGKTEEDGYQGEGCYLFTSNRFDMNFGAGSYRVDEDETETVDVTTPFGPLPSDPPSKDNFTRKHNNVYLYTNLALWPRVGTTLGLAYDIIEDRDLDENELSPKFGLQWDITDDIRLRAAAFKTIKRALIFDQTIEPTQVAAFNQFFDDPNGTESKRYGIGLDVKLTQSLFAGGEVSRRDLVVPIQGEDYLIYEDQDEDLYRAYVYWALLSTLAVSTELSFERFDREEEGDPNEPHHVETLSVPLSLRYFGRSGFFVQISPVYAHQRVDRAINSTLKDGEGDFILLNGTAGFRLPKRQGVISIEVRNLLDEVFDFQDDNFRKSEPTNPRFVPGQVVIGRVTLKF